MKAFSASLCFVVMMLAGRLLADPPTVLPALAGPPRYTPDNVYIDHFQAREASLADVLEALSVLSANSTGHHYRPTFVVIGANAARPITMNLGHVPLSAAIARLAEDTGLRVTHRGRDSVIFSARK